MEAFSSSYILKGVTDYLLMLGRERMLLLAGLEDEIEKLRFHLPLILDVLADAEEKQVSQLSVLQWLQQLKDFAYDVEDVLDKLEIEDAKNPGMKYPDNMVNKGEGTCFSALLGNERMELMRRTKKILGSLCLHGCSPFVTRVHVVDRIKELMKTFEHLLEYKKTLALVSTPAPIVLQQENQQQVSKMPQTTSIYDAHFVMIGRDNDMKELKDKLLGNDDGHQSSGRTKVSVVSVIGMGGIGKSTLAKAVYNDPVVSRHFQTKKWVSVGEAFDPIGLIKKLLGHNRKANGMLELFHGKLKSSCEGLGRFLVVLDDVWNDDETKWGNLWTPLSHGADGSKVLITTRSREVIRITGHVPTIVLKKLDDDSCLKIFMDHAFLNKGLAADPNLVEAGKEISKQLHGLPLAAKVVGSSLFCKDIGTWEKFLKDKPWVMIDKEDSVMGSLKWSYNLLPRHLKQCFGYFSLLQKDHRFSKEDLILQWMASGLLQSNGTKELEDIGDECFTNLLQLSLIEPSGYLHDPEYMMHDLIHDLAQSVASRECINFMDSKGRASENNGHVRHLFFHDEIVADGIQDYGKIRTVRIDTTSSAKSLNSILTNLKYVRVLDLKLWRTSFDDGEALPIPCLKHLRYVRVPSSRLLTDSITDSCYLQTLICGLRYRTRSNIPLLRNMSKLVHLRYLKGTLTIGTESRYRIEELGGLKELRGCLRIGGLENVIGKEDARKSRMEEKRHLRKLSLRWRTEKEELRMEEKRHLRKLSLRWRTEKEELSMKEKKHLPKLSMRRRTEKDELSPHPRDMQVLEGLEPHQSIQEIEIFGYGGICFPRWVADATVLSNLEGMSLEMCGGIQFLPALGQLPRLKRLRLSRLPGVSTIGEEFYGGGSLSDNILAFPFLERLEFEDLNNWTKWSWEDRHFPSLRDLLIRDCSRLLGLPPVFNGIRSLTVVKCGASKALVELIHDRRTGKHTAPPGPIFPLLKHLKVSDVELLDEVLGNANVFCNASMLEHAWLDHSMETGAEYWEYDESNDERGHEWAQFTSLRALAFFYCEELLYLPPHLHRLPSLDQLDIYKCDKIIALPDEGFPKSLRRLFISGGPSSALAERCKENTGADWPKISAVPNRMISCNPAVSSVLYERLSASPVRQWF